MSTSVPDVLPGRWRGRNPKFWRGQQTKDHSANNKDRANRSGIPPELVREPRIRRVELCNLVQLHW